MPVLRIPYTDPLPSPRIIPASANTASGAIASLVDFLKPSLSTSTSTTTTTPPSSLSTSAPPAASKPCFLRNQQSSPLLPKAGINNRVPTTGKTVLLTGAGISVASGLADYRGTNGTYTLNRSYRPIYYNEFCESHEARKRYWARSFLGWTNLQRARPNAGHVAAGRLGELGIVGDCITQSVSLFFFNIQLSLGVADHGGGGGRCQW